jgi:hypothetical protein
MAVQDYWERSRRKLPASAYQLRVTLPTPKRMSEEAAGLRNVLSDPAEAEDALDFLHGQRAMRFKGPGGADAYKLVAFKSSVIRALENARECA